MSSVMLLVALAVQGCVGTAVGDLPPMGNAERNGAASGSGSSPDDLFAATRSSSVTPNSIFGLWSGTASGAEVRVRFSPNFIAIAKRCSSSDVLSGAQVSARVKPGAIEVLENKVGAPPASSTSATCSLEVKTIAIPACTNGSDDDDDCFSMSGTTLDIGAALFIAQNGGSGAANDRSFTKISD